MQGGAGEAAGGVEGELRAEVERLAKVVEVEKARNSELTAVAEELVTMQVGAMVRVWARVETRVRVRARVRATDRVRDSIHSPCWLNTVSLDSPLLPMPMPSPSGGGYRG